MKFLNALLIFVTVVSAQATWAHAPSDKFVLTEQCYGNPERVSAEQPYLIMIKNLTIEEFNFLFPSLKVERLLNIESVYLSQPNSLMSFSVDISKLVFPAMVDFDVNAAVDSAVVQHIKNALNQNKINLNRVTIQCNGLVTVLPKAGGVN